MNLSSQLAFFLAITTLLFAFFLEVCLSQIPSIGKCPSKKSIHSMDLRKLSGIWHEIERTGSLAEWSYKCITFKVQPFFEHKSSLTVTAVNRFTLQLETHIVPVHIPSESEGQDDGKLMANMTIDGIHIKSVPVTILATDQSAAKSWGIAWSCRSFDDAKIRAESLWIFARQRTLEESVWTEIHEALVTLNFEHYVLRETIQTGCENGDQENNQNDI